jgi:hypothetical protein
MDDARRRLLKLLAASEDGCTDVFLSERGVFLDQVAAAALKGLATARIERTVVEGRPVDVMIVRITDAGRDALSD